MIEQLKSIGEPFEVVDAVDAQTDLLAQRSVLGTHLTAGEAACYLSHIRILQRIVDYDLDFGLILEDDFKIGDSRSLTLKNVTEHLTPEIDHLQLHNFGNHFFGEYEILERGDRFNRLKTTNVLTVGYVISKRLASHVIQNHQRPTTPIDHRYIELSRNHPDFGFYDTKERLVDVHWHFKSNIR